MSKGESGKASNSPKILLAEKKGEFVGVSEVDGACGQGLGHCLMTTPPLVCVLTSRVTLAVP